MVLNYSLFTNEGNMCNKIGTTSAFLSQSSACAQIKGACLSNQLSYYAEEDLAKLSSNQTPSYMVFDGYSFNDSNKTISKTVASEINTSAYLDLDLSTSFLVQQNEEAVVDLAFYAYIDNSSLQYELTLSNLCNANMTTVARCDSKLTNHTVTLAEFETSIMNFTEPTIKNNAYNYSIEWTTSSSNSSFTLVLNAQINNNSLGNSAYCGFFDIECIYAIGDYSCLSLSVLIYLFTVVDISLMINTAVKIAQLCKSLRTHTPEEQNELNLNLNEIVDEEAEPEIEASFDGRACMTDIQSNESICNQCSLSTYDATQFYNFPPSHPLCKLVKNREAFSVGCEFTKNDNELTFLSNSFELFLENVKEFLGLDNETLESIILSNTSTYLSNVEEYNRFNEQTASLIIKKLNMLRTTSSISHSKCSYSFFK